jgi:hypothetical protein
MSLLSTFSLFLHYNSQEPDQGKDRSSGCPNVCDYPRFSPRRVGNVDPGLGSHG